MGAGRVVSVNRGRAADLVVGGAPARSAIDKKPVPGPVVVGSLGLAGDECVDLDNHGGYDQAVYAYAREDLDWWTEQLGRELPAGCFGENVTIGGIDVTGALIGETWRLGTAVVQLTLPRVPCITFKSWLDEPHWVKRFADAGRTGVYLRVLTPGEIEAGDAIEVLARPAASVTVGESLRATYGDRELLARLLSLPGRSRKWDDVAGEVLGGEVLGG